MRTATSAYRRMNAKSAYSSGVAGTLCDDGVVAVLRGKVGATRYAEADTRRRWLTLPSLRTAIRRKALK